MTTSEQSQCEKPSPDLESSTMLSQEDLHRIRDANEQTLGDYYRKKSSIFYNVKNLDV